MSRAYAMSRGRKWALLASCLVAPLMLAITAVPLIAQRGALRFRSVRITDPLMNNEEAFRLLVPVDWRVTGGIDWHPELATLAFTRLVLTDPRSPTALEVFPSIPYTWNERGLLGVTPGGLYLGMYAVPPVDVDRVVREMLLPSVRGAGRPRLLGREALPAVARQLAIQLQEPGAVKQTEAVRTRITYQSGGQAIEEDIYCLMVYSQTPAVPGLTLWGADRVFGFRAAAGQLDRQSPVLHAIASSVRVNPRWFARYLQAREAWVAGRMEGIRQAGELSRYLSRTSAEISDMQMQAWENRQASQDRTHQRFSEYIRGVGTYHDPYQGREVELPSGYNDVWVSRAGEYILANDPNLNPNVSAGGTWERMTPRP